VASTYNTGQREESRNEFSCERIEITLYLGFVVVKFFIIRGKKLKAGSVKNE
jgi:hypothetical protein